MKGKQKAKEIFCVVTSTTGVRNAQKKQGKMSAVPEDENQHGNEWNENWNQDDWSNDYRSWDEPHWNQKWIGSLDDGSGDWSWYDDDWSYLPEDWSWNTQHWWSPEPQQSSNGASSSQANVPQDAAKNETLPNVSAVTVEPSDQKLRRLSVVQSPDG